MKLTKKIQAFTLSEILVVLILTVIVVSLAYSVLQLVQKQMYAIQGNLEKTSEINRLELALSLDFNRYQNIKYSSLDNTLRLSSPIDSIKYSFDQNKVIRAKDTFNIALDSKRLFLKGEETNNGDIDAIKLETSKETQQQPIFVFKQNDAVQFMNTN